MARGKMVAALPWEASFNGNGRYPSTVGHGLLGEIGYGRRCDGRSVHVPQKRQGGRILLRSYRRYYAPVFVDKVSDCFSPLLRILIFSTVQFISICSFHSQIADPLIGGTYMTVSHHLVFHCRNSRSASQHYFKSRRNATKAFHPARCRLPILGILLCEKCV